MCIVSRARERAEASAVVSLFDVRRGYQAEAPHEIRKARVPTHVVEVWIDVQPDNVLVSLADCFLE